MVKKKKPKSQQLVNPIIPLERPEKEDLEPSDFKDHTCHNNPDNSTSGKYIIKLPKFDYGTPEEWIIFVNLVKKVFVG